MDNGDLYDGLYIGMDDDDLNDGPDKEMDEFFDFEEASEVAQARPLSTSAPQPVPAAPAPPTNLQPATDPLLNPHDAPTVLTTGMMDPPLLPIQRDRKRNAPPPTAAADASGRGTATREGPRPTFRQTAERENPSIPNIPLFPVPLVRIASASPRPTTVSSTFPTDPALSRTVLPGAPFRVIDPAPTHIIIPASPNFPHPTRTFSNSGGTSRMALLYASRCSAAPPEPVARPLIFACQIYLEQRRTFRSVVITMASTSGITFEELYLKFSDLVRNQGVMGVIERCGSCAITAEVDRTSVDLDGLGGTEVSIEYSHGIEAEDVKERWRDLMQVLVARMTLSAVGCGVGRGTGTVRMVFGRGQSRVN